MQAAIPTDTQKKFKTMPTDNVIQKAIDTLKQNGMNAEAVNSGQEAKAKALQLIPEGAEVLTMTSITLQTLGLPEEFNESGRFDSVRNKLNSLDRATQNREMQKLGAAPDYTIGSVHAITQDGKVLIASNTGSQLAAYVYGSSHVVWIVGAQKIVKDEQEGLKRIWDYVLPLESVRARKAYGLSDSWNSNPSKILTINRETTPNRIHIVIVKEALGF